MYSKNLHWYQNYTKYFSKEFFGEKGNLFLSLNVLISTAFIKFEAENNNLNEIDKINLIEKIKIDNDASLFKLNIDEIS